VCYLGTAREDDALNILLEFVPRGSIASLLGKFGSFAELVIRMYTKQLLQGLEYLHNNGIMHHDIKGANILVDNKGCIKLADFGASKKVVEMVTITGAKSMKGTPYWMAPEVIRQTRHSLPADIWSIGCTVIEMETRKPPWSQQFQEVAVLFHIETTKSHPPIPDHLSPPAKYFLLKCLEKEPNLRPTATQLLQHPFLTGGYTDLHPLVRSSNLDHSIKSLRKSGADIRDSCMISAISSMKSSMQDMSNLASVRYSSLEGEFSKKKGNLKSIWEPNTSKGIWNNTSVEDLNCSVRLDSISKIFSHKEDPRDEKI
jgi:serine/threonine protein kinase